MQKFIWERNKKKLKEFRKREGLNKIIRDAKSEWEKIKIINDWAHHQILLAYYGHPIKPMPIDIFSQLDLLRSRKSQGWCGNYSLIFIQACLAVGIPARSIVIWGDGGDTHSVVDAWDRDCNRWVTTDPYYNIWYDSEKRHLGIYEVYEYVIKNRIDKIIIRHPLFGDYINSSQFKPDILNYFKNFGVTMRNNFITNPTPLSRFDIIHWKEKKSKKKDFFWKIGEKKKPLSIVMEIDKGGINLGELFK